MRIKDSDLNRNANNFDLIRLAAASFVLIGHSAPILLNKTLSWDPFVKLFGISMHHLGVLIFFVISGFLVTKSWEDKKNIPDFLMARILRIFPAVICLILLSVFLLGLSLTKYGITDYLSSDITLKYLQNCTVYRMYYYLPGVFETNPIGSSVNGSLWTLPYEFTCYLVLILMGILLLLKNKLGSLLFLTGLMISYNLFTEKIDTIVIPILGIDFKNFFPLFLYFVSGSVYYQFRKLIPFGLAGILLCGIIIVLINLNYLPDLMFVLILPYLIFFFTFSQKLKLHHIGKYGDFSYGIYLYAFPIQQLIVYILPIKIGVLFMILFSFILTIPCAILSWNFIEKPALNLRKKFYINTSKITKA